MSRILKMASRIKFEKREKRKKISLGNIAAIGMAVLILVGSALAMPLNDEDWNIPEINTSNGGIGISSTIEDIAVDVATTRVTYNSARDRQPTWSKDGLWIAFASTRSGSGWDIWKVHRNGESSGLKRLTTYGGFDLEPSWLPTNKIVFAAGSGQGYEDVYTMNNDGTGRTRLTTATDFDEYADWSPDGSKIAYTSVGGQKGGAKQIWIMNSDGSNKHRISTEYAIQAAWSPDGKKIAFKCYRGGYNICVMNSDGTNIKQLTQESANTHDPDWSPDGSKIIYSSARDGDWELYTMNPDGTNKRQITYNSVEDNFPSFSPDGKYIVFSSFRSGNEEIWIMPYSTSTGITLTYPNGGESWQHGITNIIKWSYSGSPGSYVKIELLKGTTVNRVISSSTPNDGSYSWIIPSTQTLGSDYKIRITSTTNSLYKDTSNNYFKIY